MVKLISSEAACTLIDRAYALKRVNPSSRVGQNLWNFVHQDHPDVADMFHQTVNDFFYERDAVKAVETFLTFYVEN